MVKTSLETMMGVKLVLSTAQIFVFEAHKKGLTDDLIDTASHNEKLIVHNIKDALVPNDILSKNLQRRKAIVNC